MSSTVRSLRASSLKEGSPIIVVPPPQMVANMKVGNMDAFCVGEPWNGQLVNQGIGFSACSTGEIWFKHPEKALGLRAQWVDKNPNAAKALLAAVMEAQQWCDKPENRQEMSEIVGRRQWFNVPVADIIGRAQGDINYGNGRLEKGTKQYMKYWSENASYPFKSHDLWFLTENKRWGYLPQDFDSAALMSGSRFTATRLATVAGVASTAYLASISDAVPSRS